MPSTRVRPQPFQPHQTLADANGALARVHALVEMWRTENAAHPRDSVESHTLITSGVVDMLTRATTAGLDPEADATPAPMTTALSSRLHQTLVENLIAEYGEDRAMWTELRSSRRIVEALLLALSDYLPASEISTPGASRASVGGYVRALPFDHDTHADAEDVGLVTSVQSDGYSVIWHGDWTPKYASFDEVEPVPASLVGRTWTRT